MGDREGREKRDSVDGAEGKAEETTPRATLFRAMDAWTPDPVSKPKHSDLQPHVAA